MFHLIWYIIVGFIVGRIASHIMPGAGHFGFIATTVIGIVGSIIGGYLARLFSRPQPGARFHRAGFLLSIVGAVLLLFILSRI